MFEFKATILTDLWIFRRTKLKKISYYYNYLFFRKYFTLKITKNINEYTISQILLNKNMRI